MEEHNVLVRVGNSTIVTEGHAQLMGNGRAGDAGHDARQHATVEKRSVPGLALDPIPLMVEKIVKGKGLKLRNVITNYVQFMETGADGVAGALVPKHVVDTEEGQKFVNVTVPHLQTEEECAAVVVRHLCSAMRLYDVK